MKKFLFITMVMLFSIFSISYAVNTPCCNSKMHSCTNVANLVANPIVWIHAVKRIRNQENAIDL